MMADSTAPERTLANPLRLQIRIVDDAIAMMLQVVAKLASKAIAYTP